MYWTLELASKLEDAPWPATKDELIDYAMRSYTWSRDTCGGKLFNTEEGLWWRDANFVPPYTESDGKPSGTGG